MGQAQSTVTTYTQAHREAFALAYYRLGSKVRASMEADVPPYVAAKWMEQKWFLAAQESIKREFDARMDSRISGLIDTALGEIQDRFENGDEKVTKYGIVKVKPTLAAVTTATGIMLDRRANLRKDPLAGGGGKPVEDDHLERIAKKLKEFMQAPTPEQEQHRTLDGVPRRAQYDVEDIEPNEDLSDLEGDPYADLADLE